ncbi:uncharacterized protein LDX57_003799 [Aspergillus melleus]|uniref:uncharacterized protein n=1 Tax=Aspergillus melleus TaxID=138277 RepID=UPI001E8D4E43|nr:uncharacterized protein LDX57_003799 [Aspergillus melleus]KAH8426059.1 hypothetical protein LDX57_003799 [Aspergillus melleus]
MPFFWGSLLGLSLVVGSNASPGLPHGYTLVKSTDLAKSTTYEEIGFYSTATTPGASATFFPKYDATVVSGKTLPFVTTTDDAGAPVTWIGDWNTNSAGSSILVPVQVCSEVAQQLDSRSKLVQKRDLVCADVSASTSRPVQTTTPKSPTSTGSTSTSSAVIPTSPSSKPSSPTTSSKTTSSVTTSSATTSDSQTTTEQSTSSKPSPSTPSSPTSPTKSPTSSTSVQSSTTENSSESTTQVSTTAQPTSTSPGSSSLISSNTTPTSPSSTPSRTRTRTSSTKSTESSSSTRSITASTQSTGDSTTTSNPSTTTGENTGTTESHSITQSASKNDKVTTTMTSEPTGFSASTVTNSDWTKDFILTTTIGGQETEVPVLTDCGDDCGDDGAIILFGVPIKTGIQYSLPNLPSFHFPCIFNCGSGGGGGKPGPPEQGEPDEDDDHSSTKSSEKTTTSEATTSEATTSTSSCTSVMTVSDCIVSCPATESCSKTCYSTMTGCDVTGTTSTTTGDPCSFTNTDYRCVNTTAATQTPGVNEVVTYTSVNYDTARAESIEKAQETQPTTLPWGNDSGSTTTSASPSQSATVTTATRTPGSTGFTTLSSPTRSPTSSPTTFSTASSTRPPICSEGNNSLMGFNNEPSSWCFCGGRGPFSTISGSTSSYCAFTKLPSETISLTSHTTSINTGCVVTSTVVTTASASETQTYCKCGHVIAGLGTTTMSSGTMMVGCQLSDWVMMTTIQPTTTSLDPSPTESANCFPTHGENDIDKILEIVQPDGSAWCNKPDTTLVDGRNPADPAGNNYIRAGWTLADDAPEDCQYLDQDETRALCADPLNEIVKQCPWNGGSIKNVCGEFWMQTCTLGKTCDVGSPD